MIAPVTAQTTWSPSDSTRKVLGRYCSRAVFPAPRISMGSLLRLIEQARLGREIGSRAAALNPLWRVCGALAGDRFDPPVGEVQRQQPLGHGVGRARHGLPGAAGDPREAALQRSLGMR